jgi:hypothetical protein
MEANGLIPIDFAKILSCCPLVICSSKTEATISIVDVTDLCELES